MKKIASWWKKKTIKEKIIFLLLLFSVYIFLVWKNIIPYKIVTTQFLSTPYGDKCYERVTWYWLGKEIKTYDR